MGDSEQRQSVDADAEAVLFHADEAAAEGIVGPGSGLARSPWLVAYVFVASLPVMWQIGQVAIFVYGLFFWIVPWFLGAMVGGLLFPQGSAFAATEFDGPIIGFAFFASIQNALLVLWWQKANRLR